MNFEAPLDIERLVGVSKPSAGGCWKLGMRCEWGAFEEGHGRESEAFVWPLPGVLVLGVKTGFTGALRGGGRLRSSVGLDQTP